MFSRLPLGMRTARPQSDRVLHVLYKANRLFTKPVSQLVGPAMETVVASAVSLEEQAFDCLNTSGGMGVNVPAAHVPVAAAITHVGEVAVAVDSAAVWVARPHSAVLLRQVSV